MHINCSEKNFFWKSKLCMKIMFIKTIYIILVHLVVLRPNYCKMLDVKFINTLFIEYMCIYDAMFYFIE